MSEKGFCNRLILSLRVDSLGTICTVHMDNTNIMT